MPFFEEYARRMDQYMPEEYLQEIQGNARTFRWISARKT